MSVITNQLDCLSEVLQDFCTKYDLPFLSINQLLIVLEQDIMANILSVLNVNQSIEFITLVGQDYNV